MHRRRLFHTSALLVTLLVGVGLGAFGYAWHGHAKHGIKSADAATIDKATETIQRLCLGLATSPAPTLTAEQRAELHVQTEALAGAIARNPDYREVFRGASHSEDRVGWVPQMQLELFELARCGATADYERLMNAALSTL